MCRGTFMDRGREVFVLHVLPQSIITTKTFISKAFNEVFKRSISYQGPFVWFSVPEELKKLHTKVFKFCWISTMTIFYYKCIVYAMFYFRWSCYQLLVFCLLRVTVLSLQKKSYSFIQYQADKENKPKTKLFNQNLINMLIIFTVKNVISLM